jgi:hypothetical protein
VEGANLGSLRISPKARCEGNHRQDNKNSNRDFQRWQNPALGITAEYLPGADRGKGQSEINEGAGTESHEAVKPGFLHKVENGWSTP